MFSNAPTDQYLNAATAYQDKVFNELELIGMPALCEFLINENIITPAQLTTWLVETIFLLFQASLAMRQTSESFFPVNVAKQIYAVAIHKYTEATKMNPQSVN